MNVYHSKYDDVNVLYEHRTMKYSEDEFPLHTPPVCEILYVKNGNITYMIEGKTYDIKKNTLVFTRASKGHSIKFNDKTQYERYLILFDDKALFNELYKKIPRDFDIIEYGNYEIINELFERFDFYCENLAGADLKKMLYNLIEELLFNILITSKDLNKSEFHIVNKSIKDAIKYIDENISTNLSVQEICDVLFITKSHLHHLFMKYLKTSPTKYIIGKKLAMAQRKLRSGAKPTEIYSTLGFSDYSSFFRAYKIHFGHSPSEEMQVQEFTEIKN